MKVRRQKTEGRKQEGNARSAGASFILHPSSFALLMGLAGVMSGAPAQVMNDPTRPPSGSGMVEPEAGAEGGGLVLQSVMISPALKAAIINGAMVKLGEKYGDAVLVRVAENEVVLKSGDESQVLKLHPGVEKRETAPIAAKTPSRKRKAPRGGTDSTAPGSPAAR